MSKWNEPASQTTIDVTVAALQKRNIEVEVVETSAAALVKIKSMIPPGADVMTASSLTLEQIGFTGLLKSGNHPWHNLKDAIMAEKDPVKQGLLRRRSVTSDYFLGSVHALAQTGEILVASGSGSQIPAYAYASAHVIWVVGTQKITSGLDEAMKRLDEYVFPLEDARMKKVGFPGAMIGKILIFQREMIKGRVTLILVKEKLGF